jgi:hypothetical protein
MAALQDNQCDLDHTIKTSKNSMLSSNSLAMHVTVNFRLSDTQKWRAYNAHLAPPIDNSLA